MMKISKCLNVYIQKKKHNMYLTWIKKQIILRRNRVAKTYRQVLIKKDSHVALSKQIYLNSHPKIHYHIEGNHVVAPKNPSPVINHMTKRGKEIITAIIIIMFNKLLTILNIMLGVDVQLKILRHLKHSWVI